MPSKTGGTVEATKDVDATEEFAAADYPSLLQRLRRNLSFRNISAIYLFVALFALYSLWVPDTFLTSDVWRSLLDNGALTALVAVGLTLPLAAGVFNLAIGAEVGFAAIVVAWALTKLNVPVPVALALTIAGGALVGIVNGFLITWIRIPSFIATLGMSSVLLALITWLSNGQQILNLGEGFQKIGTNQLLGITYPVWIALVMAIICFYVLERTSAGRRIYAVGGNESAARLAGIRTPLVVIISLAACGAIAALAGALATSRIATGDPTIGPAYLLPAYAAVFLGSTQFRGGRYNIWGTVLAVYVLAVGVKGLQLAGAPVWIPELFNGMALLIAVGASSFQSRAGAMQALRRLRRRGQQGAPNDSAAEAGR